MDMRLHGSWRRTGLLGYLGIVLAFYVTHTKDATALLRQGVYGGIYLTSHLGVLHALMRIGKGRLDLLHTHIAYLPYSIHTLLTQRIPLKHIKGSGEDGTIEESLYPLAHFHRINMCPKVAEHLFHDVFGITVVADNAAGIKEEFRVISVEQSVKMFFPVHW